MKKVTLLLISLLLSMILSAQIKEFKDLSKDVLSHLYEMGMNNNPILSKYESEYFNEFFNSCRGDFNFSEKKVAFIRGGLRSKEDYFRFERSGFQRNSHPNNGWLVILNSTQKKESGGYDAIIIYWTKKEKSVEDLLKIIKKSNKKKINN